MKFNTKELSGISGILLVLLLLIPAPLMTGCAVTSAQIVADAQVVAAAATSVGNMLMATDPALANNIILAAKDLSLVASQWQSGNTLAIITSALNALDIVLASIPIPMVQLVAEFLPIAVAGI